MSRLALIGAILAVLAASSGCGGKSSSKTDGGVATGGASSGSGGQAGSTTLGAGGAGGRDAGIGTGGVGSGGTFGSGGISSSGGTTGSAGTSSLAGTGGSGGLGGSGSSSRGGGDGTGGASSGGTTTSVSGTGGKGGTGAGGTIVGTGGKGGTGGSTGGTGGSIDAGTPTPMCWPAGTAACSTGLSCLCYTWAAEACYCSTSCTTDSDCTDPARPHCGGCNNSFLCLPTDAPAVCCSCKCAAPDTPIATPDGERPIAALIPGDLVISRDRGQLVAVPILRTNRVPVTNHHVVELLLDNGARLRISEGHPTADGRAFADLRPGDHLGEARVMALRSIAYPFAFTYDILPASDSRTYVAGGALIGSTIAP